MKNFNKIWLWPIGSVLVVLVTLIVSVNLSSHSYRKISATASSISSSSQVSSSQSSLESSSSPTLASTSTSTSSSSSSAKAADPDLPLAGNYYYGPGIGPQLKVTVSGDQATIDGTTYIIDTANKSFTQNGQIAAHYYYSNGFLAYYTDNNGFNFGVNDALFNINSSDNVTAGDIDGDYYYGGGNGFSKTFSISGDTMTYADGSNITIDFSNHTLTDGSTNMNFWYSHGMLVFWSDNGGFGFGLNSNTFNVN